MSGTRSTSRKAPATEPRSKAKLALILIPFVWGAIAINLFMLALMAQALGWPNLSPWATMAVAVPLTLPGTWLATRWVGGLLDEAERG